MKISKIIFLSLVGVIALIMIAVALDIRINGTKGSQRASGNFNENKIAIPPFKVLCLNSSKNVTIEEGDSCYILVNFPKDSLSSNLNYVVRKDTLILSDCDWNKKRIFCKISVTSKPDQFFLNNSNINLNNFKGNYVIFNLDNSNINILKNTKGGSSISFLDIKERNKSRIYGNGISLDSLRIDIQDSRTELHSNVKKVNGNVSGKGYLHLDSANEITLKKDSDSKIMIY